MSTAKQKPSALKPTRASATRVSTAPGAQKPSPALMPAMESSGKVSGDSILEGEATGKTVGDAFHKTFLSDRLLSALGPMHEINISNARSQLPKMVKSCVEGTVFLIVNAKRADSPPAVLIGMAELERVVQKVTKAPSRTLGEILDSLPFSGMELRSPQVKAIPGGGLPTLRIP